MAHGGGRACTGNWPCDRRTQLGVAGSGRCRWGMTVLSLMQPPHQDDVSAYACTYMETAFVERGADALHCVPGLGIVIDSHPDIALTAWQAASAKAPACALPVAIALLTALRASGEATVCARVREGVEAGLTAALQEANADMGVLGRTSSKQSNPSNGIDRKIHSSVFSVGRQPGSGC